MPVLGDADSKPGLAQGLQIIGEALGELPGRIQVEAQGVLAGDALERYEQIAGKDLLQLPVVV